MHNLAGGLVLGYHGCDAAVGEELLSGAPFQPSNNDWDWLGHGVYFWEANPKRGFDFAAELKAARYKHAKIAEPFVVGVVLSLGLCLDTTAKAGIDIVRTAHADLLRISSVAGVALPQNDLSLLRRNLDCAVIQHVHRSRADAGAPEADTVRGVFVEGGPIYAQSGFHEKTHIQIAIRNSDCIKGVFRVPKALYE